MTGYQQAILFLNGSRCGDTFRVRNTERHYIDAVADLAPRSRPFLQKNSQPNKSDYWVLKSCRLSLPKLAEVQDWRGFCRGFIELQGILDIQKIRGNDRLRLRIYGQPDVLRLLMDILPATLKKVQSIKTLTGETSAVYYQSQSEIYSIFDYIDGVPKCSKVWAKWADILSTERKFQ